VIDVGGGVDESKTKTTDEAVERASPTAQVLYDIPAAQGKALIDVQVTIYYKLKITSKPSDRDEAQGGEGGWFQSSTLSSLFRA
jgi:hypothetical protein